jgi:hypothetical protein
MQKEWHTATKPVYMLFSDIYSNMFKTERI